MKTFSLLVKPASYRCNLRCSYCFYIQKEQLFKNSDLMSEEVLDKMISSFLALGMPQSSFGWQGGEPTLMGLDFFRKVISFQQKYGRQGQLVSNGLQTNGVLLDDEWCRHLAKYNFLVGISIDGPPEIHDNHRVTVKGEPSHALVMKGLEALKRNKVEYNVLTLVSDSNAEKPLAVYNYLKDLGVNYHQYIECVEFDSNGKLAPYAVNPLQWGEFLCRIFDEWYEKDKFKVSVRLFDSILAMMVDDVANACSIARDCCQYLVVEHNGDVFPCDFFVEPDLKLGNVMDGSWEDFIGSQKYKAFGERKSMWNAKCDNCQYIRFCSGCCPKNRSGRGQNPRELSALCAGWELFFQHTLERFRKIAGHVRRERELALERERTARRMEMAKLNPGSRKIGRNDPCHCGSGIKYKKCCGK